MAVDIEWWKFSLPNFKRYLEELLDEEVLEGYNHVADLAAKEKGWKTKRKLLIEEMGYRHMSFTM